MGFPDGGVGGVDRDAAALIWQLQSIVDSDLVADDAKLDLVKDYGSDKTVSHHGKWSRRSSPDDILRSRNIRYEFAKALGTSAGGGIFKSTGNEELDKIVIKLLNSNKPLTKREVRQVFQEAKPFVDLAMQKHALSKGGESCKGQLVEGNNLSREVGDFEKKVQDSKVRFSKAEIDDFQKKYAEAQKLSGPEAEKIEQSIPKEIRDQLAVRSELLDEIKSLKAELKGWTRKQESIAKTADGLLGQEPGLDDARSYHALCDECLNDIHAQNNGFEAIKAKLDKLQERYNATFAEPKKAGEAEKKDEGQKTGNVEVKDAKPPRSAADIEADIKCAKVKISNLTSSINFRAGLPDNDPTLQKLNHNLSNAEAELKTLEQELAQAKAQPPKVDPPKVEEGPIEQPNVENKEDPIEQPNVEIKEDLIEQPNVEISEEPIEQPPDVDMPKVEEGPIEQPNVEIKEDLIEQPPKVKEKKIEIKEDPKPQPKVDPPKVDAKPIEEPDAHPYKPINSKEALIDFLRGMKTAQSGKVVAGGKHKDINGIERQLYTYQGLVFRADSRHFGHETLKDGFTSKNDLRVEKHLIEAMGLGAVTQQGVNGAYGATGTSGVSCARTVGSCINYALNDGSCLYIIDTTKIGAKNTAWDMSSIVVNNELGPDRTGNEVNVSHVPREAVVGYIKIPDKVLDLKNEDVKMDILLKEIELDPGIVVFNDGKGEV